MQKSECSKLHFSESKIIHKKISQDKVYVNYLSWYLLKHLKNINWILQNTVCEPRGFCFQVECAWYKRYFNSNRSHKWKHKEKIERENKK